MKLLGKIGVILLAALMVAGATLALDNSGALSSLTGGAGHGGEGRSERPAGAPADAGSAFAPGERPASGGEGGRDGWAGGLLNVARNLGLVAAVVAGVWLIGWLARQTATRRKLAKAEMPPAKEQLVTEEKL